jgi:hypothetical protein
MMQGWHKHHGTLLTVCPKWWEMGDEIGGIPGTPYLNISPSCSSYSISLVFWTIFHPSVHHFMYNDRLKQPVESDGLGGTCGASLGTWSTVVLVPQDGNLLNPLVGVQKAHSGRFTAAEGCAAESEPGR